MPKFVVFLVWPMLVSVATGVHASQSTSWTGPQRAEAGDEDPVVMEEIIVWGRAESQKGEALSSSSGLVGYADFSTRPLQRVGELVEVVPGMVATQHSGEGKANQYYLRGMNLDHGTDFSAYFEGMPVNLRSHAHGQGYLDLNFLIPEVISTVRYSKGPYTPDRGDFSTAGTTSIAIYDELDAPFVEITAGTDDYERVLSQRVPGASGETSVLAAVESHSNDGPWELPAEVEKLNALVKLTAPVGPYEMRLIATYYDNDWRSTDQIPRRLVQSNAVDRFGFVDPTTGGQSTRANLIGGIEGDRLKAGVYASRYELNLFGNFTYFAEDPVNGDQHEQVDRRWIYGAHVEYRYPLSEVLTFRGGWRPPLRRHQRCGSLSHYGAGSLCHGAKRCGGMAERRRIR